MNNAIEIHNLCKRYDTFSLQNISFTVPTGSIVGFVGENGAGKTTTIKSILDVVHKDSGSITLLGHDHTDAVRARADVGVVYDEISFHDWLNADQIGDILKGIFPTWSDSKYKNYLTRFGLHNITGNDKRLKNYSRGMKMKLSLATAMAHQPKLLILDEATSGLDPVVRDEILDMFLDFIQDESHSILFSSHITSDIEKIADYVVFIHEGKILFSEEKDTLLEQYAVLRCSADALHTLDNSHIVGIRKNTYGIDVLVNDKSAFSPTDQLRVDKATIDDIMLLTIKGEHI